MRTLAEIQEIWGKTDGEYKAKRDKIQARIEQRQAQVRRLEEKRAKLKRPGWIEELVTPIAEEIRQRLGYETFKMSGPFGICARVWLEFFKVAGDHDYLGVNLEPGDLTKGTFDIRDYSREVKEFSEGSIGQMNDLNFARIEVGTIEDIMAQLHPGTLPDWEIERMESCPSH